ncbi:PREDICTED: uncharacterized protein LOC108372065 [Rhagoletis zephyria]|uniref:uncharacterized protein LOC108372065 n=1 Tax=Rhagoletis zephyria TaxID=28612 RepID=UPI0008119728|nr:PREDICTED: uncharacterized protein LOC108372065 [Rhagoletis zephyria]
MWVWLLQSTTTTTSTESSANRGTVEYVSTSKEFEKSAVFQTTNPKIAHKITQLSRNEKQPNTLVTIPQSGSVNTISKYARSISQPKVNAETTRSVPVVRANYALESSRSLEELLRKRESDLRRRREHVERLMQWHRRLDREEAEVLQMENALVTYTKPIITDVVKKIHQNHAGVVPIKNIGTRAKTHRRLKEIENSLRELNNISSTHTTAESNEGSGEENKTNALESVRTSGNKLNKLWRRLTSQQVGKYVPNKHYELSKADLESLYENAKIAVLQDFAQNEGHLPADLLEKSISKNISQTSLQQQQQHESVFVPSLNLCTSSEPSDKEEESWEGASPNSLLLEAPSPTIAAENFKLFDRDSNSIFLMTKHNSESNLYPKMRNLSSWTTRDVGLIRSLSDTVLYNKCRSPHDNKNKLLNIYKDGFAENSRRSMSNADRLPPYKTETNVKLPPFFITSQQKPSEQENDVLIPDALQFTTASNLQMEGPSVINSPNISGESTTRRKTATEIEENFVDPSLGNEQSKHTSSETAFHTLNDKLKRTYDDQEIQNSPQLISSCAQSSCSSEVKSNDGPHQILSFVISTASNQEQIDNDTSSLSKNIYDSNENQSIDEQESFNSKTFVSQSVQSQSSENETVDTYEEDFESTCELTKIDDLSLPHFDSIFDTSLGDKSGIEDCEDCENQIQTSKESKNIYQDVPTCSRVLEKLETTQPLLSNLDISTAAPPPLVPSATDSTRYQSTAQNINYENTSPVNTVQLMPDIINELEIRRCQQILIENEQKIKQFDNPPSVMPYMYVREIPNKPPPPYVPPAHGSPMTTIFPSEERIKEISYRRTHELYSELLKTDYINESGEKLPSVMDEKITNIYERIILDICREYLDEHVEVLRKGDPINFYTHLAFFNPPNRLRCMQESVYKEVRRCLAMDKTTKRRTPIYSVYGQRAKRDHIGKIIIQEMYDEDEKWCNFHREENEVVELIIYEMVQKLLTDVAKKVLVEEGGTIEISNVDKEDESDENIHLISHVAELTPLNST